MKKQKQAFTLVELIVVIVILAILGTIAFISLQGYSANSRDSVRISDISTLKTALGVYHVGSGKYPLPDGGEEVSYSGEILRYQGTIGETVIKNLSRSMTKIPTDPSSNMEYVYSVTSDKNSYEILNLLESDISYGQSYMVNALNSTRVSKIDGTYNGLYVKTKSLIFPTPSIINAEPIIKGAGLVLDTNNIKSQVIDGGENIPNVGGNIITKTGALDINLSVYNGIINKDSTDQEKIDVIKAIQGAYSGTSLAGNDIYSIILSKTIDEDLLKIAGNIFFEDFLYNSNGGESGLTSGGNQEIPLYLFETHTFTNCGQTGRIGPSLTQCKSIYDTTWDEDTSYYNMITNGIQEWTIPQTGTYRIEVAGARGGNGTSTGGKGAIIIGEFSLNQNSNLKILVGQTGIDGSTRSGGGGGTFVALDDNIPLIVAGGGGGGSDNKSGVDASILTSGTYAYGYDVSTYKNRFGGPGINGGGGGGGICGSSGGGGGFYGDGGAGSTGVYCNSGGGVGGDGINGSNGICGTLRTGTQGKAFINGGEGGLGSGAAVDGGFGGGSGIYVRNIVGGSGGGYSGGGGTPYGGTFGGGGGGGSYIIGTATNISTSVTNSAHGYVIITKL